MPKVSQEQHQLACIHEAAHAIMFHVMGYHVIKATALLPEERARRDLGETAYIDEPADDLQSTERMAIAICAGYVAEMIFFYCVERFDGEDIIQLCNRDGGYEAGYAHHICDHTADDLFETVIFKARRYLQSTSIANAVHQLAALLHRTGEANYGQIASIARRNGAAPLF